MPDIKIILIRRPVTIALLVLTTLAMAALLWALSGRAYAKDPPILNEILALAGDRPEGRSQSVEIILLLTPPAADILFFVPWGFLAFMALDRPHRPRFRTVAATALGGLVFALTLSLWQYALPTLVIDLRDVFWNTIGALCGAGLGWLRKGVRVRFV
ncbi:MAG TPA: VanZ family protein [Thermoanaerobaculia bacterium]|nr:VanZ family protein [Thermoanaerobaculia bacterium]